MEGKSDHELGQKIKKNDNNAYGIVSIITASIILVTILILYMVHGVDRGCNFWNSISGSFGIPLILGGILTFFNVPIGIVGIFKDKIRAFAIIEVNLAISAIIWLYYLWDYGMCMF